MKKYTLLKTTAASSMIAALLSITTGCVTAPGYNAYGDLYEDIYKDTKIYKKHKKTIKSIDKELYQPAIEQRAANEPPRDCRRPNILREYDNENTTLYS